MAWIDELKVTRQGTLLDDITDSHLLRKYIPTIMDASLQQTKHLRDMVFEAAPISSNGGRLFNATGDMAQRHVASIPWFVMAALLAQEPDIMDDNGSKFMKWLSRHPEYKVAG